MITIENPIRLLDEDLTVFRDDQGRPRVLGLHCSVILIIQLLFIVFFATLAWTQETDWEKNWRQVVTAAQREGKVVVMGSADPVLRRELPARFKARFGLNLEYLAGRGTANFTRLRMERRAGHYSVDVVMAGMQNMVDYYNEKIIKPLLPALMLPEVLDGSKWKKGKLWFLDPEGKYVLRLYYYLSGGIVYFNTDYAKREDFKSVKALLDPKWRGKISSLDPSGRGPGQADATRFYMKFGEEFVKRLYIDQKPAFSRNKRQLADWLGRGTYPVSLNAETEFVIEMKEQGLPVDMFPVPDGPATLSAGNGLLALIDKAPHPNAARVVVNWIASREGVEILGRARHKPTTRNDVDESYVIPWEIPLPGTNYIDTYNWDFTTTTKRKLHRRLREILKPR